MNKDNRWRGQMPFRLNRRYRPSSEPIKQQGRGREPSLAYLQYVVKEYWPMLDEVREQGHGKAVGSFTEKARMALFAWLEAQGLDFWHSPISFQYRMYRRKIVTVTLTRPMIFHRPLRGDGTKGFVLEGAVVSIDGQLPRRRYMRAEFVLTRIIGQHPIRLLAEGGQS